jgi:lysophospholipase L1-like esterase
MNDTSASHASFQISWRLLTLIFCLVSVSASFASVKPHPVKKPAAAPAWVGTWATAPQLVEPQNMPPAPGLTNNTLRQVVCVSVGGKKLHIRFANYYSKDPVTMKSVQIAVSKGDGKVDESTTKTLMFDSKNEYTMAPGTDIVSDPVSFNLEPRMEVAITIYFGETSQTVTGHPGSRTTSYILAGDHTAKGEDFSAAVKTDHWYVINAIDVEGSKNATATVAILGDSITDGRGSGTNKQDRWPDILMMDLQKDSKTKSIGVLNLGIGGNAVLRGGLGPFALSRYDRDIIKQSGVKWVIVYEGVNDLGGKRDSTMAMNTATGLIAAYQKMIADAHAAGLKIYGATITPFKKNNYYNKFSDAARNMVNDWIRVPGHFDAVIDFDKTVRDPADPAKLQDDLQSGANDYLHLNEVGYQTMGNSIPLSLFK